MSICEMCGKKESSAIALVEGTELSICSDCSKFGKIVKKISHVEQMPQKSAKIIAKKPEEPEIIETIVEGYGDIVKKSREKLNLTQEEFAKKINEKVSVVHSIESEHHEPNIELAKKLEKFLKVKLIEQEKVENKSFGKTDSNSLTIGDILKIKK